MSHHVFGDGWLGNLDTQFQQLAVNAWCTPARVVTAHHPDQIADLLRHAGPTWLAAADSPRPEEAEAFTMPGDNCFGRDDHQSGFPVAPHAPQPDPEDSRGGRRWASNRVGGLNRSTNQCRQEVEGFDRRSMRSINATLCLSIFLMTSLSVWPSHGKPSSTSFE